METPLWKMMTKLQLLLQRSVLIIFLILKTYLFTVDLTPLPPSLWTVLSQFFKFEMFMDKDTMFDNQFACSS